MWRSLDRSVDDLERTLGGEGISVCASSYSVRWRTMNSDIDTCHDRQTVIARRRFRHRNYFARGGNGEHWGEELEPLKSQDAANTVNRVVPHYPTVRADYAALFCLVGRFLLVCVGSLDDRGNGQRENFQIQ